MTNKPIGNDNNLPSKIANEDVSVYLQSVVREDTKPFCKHCNRPVSVAAISKPCAEEEVFPFWVSSASDRALHAAAKLHGAPDFTLCDYFATKIYLERSIRRQMEREPGIASDRFEGNIDRLLLLLEEPICIPFTYLFCGDVSEPSAPSDTWCFSNLWMCRGRHFD